MRAKWICVLALLLVLIAGRADPAKADGIIVPPFPPPCEPGECPPLPRPMAQLEIRYHHVTVTIQDQIAVTRVDQVFYNPNDWPVEGTYIFPIPNDAAVSDFTLWVDGEPVAGEVLTAEEARAIYEDTVRSLRDPALLEYEGRGALKASVFPIQPEAERRIELEYTQVLTAENGLVRYVYPLNTEKFSAQPLEDIRIRVEISDRQPVRAVYSPSHPVALDRQDENHVTAGYEAQDVLPDSDFDLFYSLGETEAFHLFSYRDPSDLSDPEGFFMLLLAPKPGGEQQPVAKDVLLVLDRSGSMDGEKFRQAQSALRYILSRLNPEDRFYLQTFSTGIETYADGLRPASEAAEAIAWVDRLSAAGSTDINRALLEAAAVMDRERPTYLIFLTDGLPTEGVVETQQILDNFAGAAPDNLRLFAFGVGYDVDTILLDSLSQGHHGLSTYVRPGELLDETLSAFYERISAPVLTDLSLDFGDLAVYDIYPNPLPDLFSGTQIVVVGRYREGGTQDIVLTGLVNGERQTFRFSQLNFAADSRGGDHIAALPRLWATRKIGYLLNQVRLNGPDKETIEQIVQLSVRYGIVTPYTSYLVTEPDPLGAESQEKIVEEAFQNAQSVPLEASGAGAVDRAAQEGALQSADAAPAPELAGAASGDGSGTMIRTAGMRTFLLQEGIWVDTTYDSARMKTQEILFLSDAYFKLLEARPDLAPALALGDQVIVVVGDTAYRIGPEADVSQPLLPDPLPTAEPGSQDAVPVETPVPGHQTEDVPAAATQPAGSEPRQTAFCMSLSIPVGAVLLFGWASLRRKKG